MTTTLNPLSDFWTSQKDGKRLEERFAVMAKAAQFRKDKGRIKAVNENLMKITLGEESATEDMVDKVAGVWRIQNEFSDEIMRIRDKDMILLNKINRVENTLFEFWSAKIVGYNCYGPFVSSNNQADCIVAKYETDDGVYWGYGTTLEEARAFLGLKLYDEYKDLINSVACRNKLQNQKK